MCFSYEASLLSFIVGSVSSIFVYLLGRPFDKIVGGLWLWICLMQGIEAFLWKNQTCDDIHKRVSFIGFLVNVNQPVVLAILLVLFSKYARPIPISIISTIYILYGFVERQHPDTYYCTTPRKGDPHLVYNWSITPEYMTYDWLAYCGAMIGIAYFGMSGLQAFSFLITIGLLLFGSYLFYPRESIASIWCFFAAFAPPVYLALRKVGYL
jgi:hypothetical protein